MFWLLVVLVIGLWTGYYRWQRRRIYKVAKEIAFCNLPTLPLLGNAHLFAGSDEDRMGTLQKLGLVSLKNGGLCSLWMSNKLYVVIADPVVAEIVLKSCLDKDETTMKFIRTLTGNGSLATPVNIWRPRRKVMAPLFSLKNLNCFVSVFATQSEIMVKRMQQEVGNGDFSFWKYINTYTFDSICKTSLGIDLNSQLNPDQPCLEAFDIVLHILSQRLCSPWLYLDSVYKLLPCYKTFLTNRNKIYDFVDDLIKCKSKEMAARDNASEKQTETLDPDSKMQCLLEIMIKSSGGAKGYTDLELREEMLVIILAGTDTSAVGAAYTALMLSRHPEVQEKVFQELQAVFQGSNRPVAVNDLPNLKYLEAVIKETLRIYPPVPVVVREVINDVELPSGKTLVNGVGILMNFWAMHRNPKYWGEDAEQFRPERFLEGPLKHPGQFMPFSYSMRNCVGSTYAMMSMKTVLATLVRQYRLLPPADLTPQQWADPLRVKWDIMMKHVDNYMIRIKRRKLFI